MASGLLVEQQPFLVRSPSRRPGGGRGLLGALVDPVAQWARPLATGLLLEVHEDNARAHQGLGLVETGRTHPYPLEPGGLERVIARGL